MLQNRNHEVQTSRKSTYMSEIGFIQWRQEREQEEEERRNKEKNQKRPFIDTCRPDRQL